MAGSRIGKFLAVGGEAVQDDREGVCGRSGNSAQMVKLGYRDRLV